MNFRAKYCQYCTSREIIDFQKAYDEGISWGEAKEVLFNIVNTEIEPIRSKYEDLSKDKNFINEVLEDGSKNARILAKDKIAQIREVIGITKIS